MSHGTAEMALAWVLVVAGFMLMVSAAANGSPFASALGAAHVVVGFLRLSRERR